MKRADAPNVLINDWAQVLVKRHIFFNLVHLLKIFVYPARDHHRLHPVCGVLNGSVNVLNLSNLREHPGPRYNFVFACIGECERSR